MAHFKLLLALSLFLSLTFVVNATYWVVTKRPNKIIVGVQHGSFTHLKEETWDPEYPYTSADWEIYSDPRFPNGVFFELWDGRVWDIKGNNAVTGAAVILYAKKQTQLDSRNQRWVRTASGQYASILNPEMVITVNATGFLVMGKNNATNPLQQFYPVALSYIEVKNNRESEVYATSTSSSFGWGPHVIIPAFDYEYEWQTYYVMCFVNSIVYFKDGYGNVLPPSPVNFTGQELYLTFEDANTIPVGTHRFVGEINSDTYTEMTISISSSGDFSGTGYDGFIEKTYFDVYGSFSGYQLTSFTKVFDDGYYNYIWDGAVSYDPFVISGTLRDDQNSFLVLTTKDLKSDIMIFVQSSKV